MLIDVLNPANYLMLNRDAVRIFGLNAAAYCSELLTIYKKAVTKKKIYDEIYVKVDRDYITKQTTLSVDEQLSCDKNLEKVNVVRIHETDPDLIFFNVEVFATIIASEDISIQEKVREKVKSAKPKGTKQAIKARQIMSLKEHVECKNSDVLFAYYDWIDTLMTDPSRYLSSAQVAAFQKRINEYCGNDYKKAVEVINIAMTHAYIDAQWAINIYERDNRPPQYNNSNRKSNLIHLPEQKQSTAFGTDEF